MTSRVPRTYSLHGLRLEVAGWEPAVAGVDARLRRLATAGGRGDVDDGRNGDPEPLRFDFRDGDGPPLAPPGRGRPVYDPPDGRVLYSDRDDLLYIEIGAPRLAALCRLTEGRVEIASLRPRPGDLWLLSHPLFTLPLCELAKRRGLFSLHAGGLCRGGRALLLPGASGAGKSTLSVALARAGFGLLGDDTVFLRRGPGGPRVLGFPDEVDLTEESVALLSAAGPRRTTALPRLPGAAGENVVRAGSATPALPPALWAIADLLPESQIEGARKRSLGPEILAAGGLVAECAPGWLVFPRISGRAESALAPMPRDEALLALAPDVLLTEPRSSQAHLDALAELVAASECFRLATGRDLAGAVRLLDELTGDTPARQTAYEA